jgi:hypothetical protein
MNAVRVARSEDDLMLGVGKALDAALVDVGRAGVREIVTGANRLGVDPNDLPYVFWALNSKSGLPRLGAKEQKAFDMMFMIMSRTGTMPNYSSSFTPSDNLATDAAIDVLAPQLGTWALRVMYPSLLSGYRAALKTQERKVPRATNNRVSKSNAFDFLRKTFRYAVSLKSSMFRDGELLRRIVRLLPI